MSFNLSYCPAQILPFEADAPVMHVCLSDKPSHVYGLPFYWLFQTGRWYLSQPHSLLTTSRVNHDHCTSPRLTISVKIDFQHLKSCQCLSLTLGKDRQELWLIYIYKLVSFFPLWQLCFDNFHSDFQHLKSCQCLSVTLGKDLQELWLIYIYNLVSFFPSLTTLLWQLSVWAKAPIWHSGYFRPLMKRKSLSPT